MPAPEPGANMRRREFLTVLGGAAAAWPLSPHAQQVSVPIVGFLHVGSPVGFGHLVTAFRRGLASPILLRAVMWRSNTAGPKASSILCRRWWPI